MFSSPPGLVGFFPRLGAVLIDLVVLYLIASLANRLFRDPLLSMGFGATYAAAAAMILYFALATGQIGGGRTLGKYILKFRVCDQNGNTLTPVAALIRSVVATAPALIIVIMSTIRTGPHMGDNYDLILTLKIVQQGVLALLVSNILCILFDPLKRSFQDLIAGSVVVKCEMQPEDTPDIVESARAMGQTWGGLQRIMLVAPFVLFVGLEIPKAQSLRNQLDPEFIDGLKSRYEDLRQIAGTGDWFEPHVGFAPDRPGPDDPKAGKDKPIRSFAFVIDFLAFQSPPEEIVSDLEDVEEALPELRRWSVDYISEGLKDEERRQRQKAEESGKDTDSSANAIPAFEGARVEISFSTVLNLGYPFRSEPLAEFTEPLSQDDLRGMGLFDDSATSPTLSTSKPSPSESEPGKTSLAPAD